eukprot:TRINITY_DN24757_c0_g1_i2.p1 TRINITY_DN24757_c0_g1~~TRINITY_DN24757_c0_g1_i2.p1  ORF type:complete len:341 (+),score=89.74 TRINITY_DN24757_c0_g1_i2:116-1138(+)
MMSKNFTSAEDISPKKRPETVTSSREESRKDVKETVASKNPTSLAPKKGMQLSKKKGPESQPVVETVTKAREEEIIKEAHEEHRVNPLKEPVTVEILEKMNCSMTRDGVVTSFEVVGEVLIEFHDPSKTNSTISLDHENLKSFNIKPHPSLNRALWNSSATLAPKEGGEGFPCFSKFSTIKWRYASSEVNDVPFQFTQWQTKDSLTLEVEFNGNQKRFASLTNLDISFTVTSKDKPTVASIEASEYEIKGSKFIWRINQLDQNTSQANIAITFPPSVDINDLYPFDVSLISENNFYPIKVREAINLNESTPLKVQTIRSCLLYTSPSPRDRQKSRMPSSA